MTNFHVGQMVKCVNMQNIINIWHRSNPLTVGGIYQVLRVGDDGLIAVDRSGRLWQSWRFRTLKTRKSDISIFTAMLNKTKEPQHGQSA